MSSPPDFEISQEKEKKQKTQQKQPIVCTECGKYKNNNNSEKEESYNGKWEFVDNEGYICPRCWKDITEERLEDIGYMH